MEGKEQPPPKKTSGYGLGVNPNCNKITRSKVRTDLMAAAIRGCCRSVAWADSAAATT